MSDINISHIKILDLERYIYQSPSCLVIMMVVAWGNVPCTNISKDWGHKGNKVSAKVYSITWLTIHYCESIVKYCYDVSRKGKSLGHVEKFGLNSRCSEINVKQLFDKTTSQVETELNLIVSFNIWVIIV